MLTGVSIKDEHAIFTKWLLFQIPIFHPVWQNYELREHNVFCMHFKKDDFLLNFCIASSCAFHNYYETTGVYRNKIENNFEFKIW